MLYFATATGTAILSTRQESASCRFSEVFDIFQYFRLSNSVNMQWTDADLYAKYNLTEEEIAFIESTIKPMM